MPKYTTPNLLPEKNNNNYPDLNKPATRKEQQNSKKNNFQKIKLLQKLPQKVLYRNYYIRNANRTRNTTNQQHKWKYTRPIIHITINGHQQQIQFITTTARTNKFIKAQFRQRQRSITTTINTTSLTITTTKWSQINGHKTIQKKLGRHRMPNQRHNNRKREHYSLIYVSHTGKILSIW